MAEGIVFRGIPYKSTNSVWKDLKISLSVKEGAPNRDIVLSSLKKNEAGMKWLDLKEVTEKLANKLSIQEQDMAVLFSAVKDECTKGFTGVEFSATKGGRIENPFSSAKRGREAREKENLAFVEALKLEAQ